MANFQRTSVDHIPVVWCKPQTASNSGTPETSGKSEKIVIWLPGFGGDKESVLPQLSALSDAGFTALSFDPFQHGERRIETNQELGARVVGNIRRHFWPILASSAEDVVRVLDWAQENLKFENAGIGGISMGGDIAVAAAGLDARLVAVAACIATADWLRPGSHEIPGAPDAYARACFYRANPLGNLQGYEHQPAISFQSGQDDTQVPPEGGAHFIEILRALHPQHTSKFEVQLHPATAHQFTDKMWSNCLAWYEKWL